jgi:hypothetical protein
VSSLRRDGLAVLAGTVSGCIVLGVGGRAVMTFTALLAGVPPRFSWAGSLEVVILGAIYGAVGGVLLAVIRRRWPGGGLRGGLALGALLCGIAWLTSAVGRDTARSSPVAIGVLVGCSVLAFLLYGVAAAWLAMAFEPAGHSGGTPPMAAPGTSTR